ASPISVAGELAPDAANGVGQDQSWRDAIDDDRPGEILAARKSLRYLTQQLQGCTQPPDRSRDNGPTQNGRGGSESRAWCGGGVLAARRWLPGRQGAAHIVQDVDRDTENPTDQTAVPDEAGATEDRV